MVKCAGCGGSVKPGRSFIEELKSGRLVPFCCLGCSRLFKLEAAAHDEDLTVVGLG